MLTEGEGETEREDRPQFRVTFVPVPDGSESWLELDILAGLTHRNIRSHLRVHAVELIPPAAPDLLDLGPELCLEQVFPLPENTAPITPRPGEIPLDLDDQLRNLAPRVRPVAVEERAAISSQEKLVDDGVRPVSERQVFMELGTGRSRHECRTQNQQNRDDDSPGRYSVIGHKLSALRIIISSIRWKVSIHKYARAQYYPRNPFQSTTFLTPPDFAKYRFVSGWLMRNIVEGA